jgi:hypothetical protein
LKAKRIYWQGRAEDWKIVKELRIILLLKALWSLGSSN